MKKYVKIKKIRVEKYYLTWKESEVTKQWDMIEGLLCENIH